MDLQSVPGGLFRGLLPAEAQLVCTGEQILLRYGAPAGGLPSPEALLGILGRWSLVKILALGRLLVFPRLPFFLFWPVFTELPLIILGAFLVNFYTWWFCYVILVCVFTVVPCLGKTVQALKVFFK